MKILLVGCSNDITDCITQVAEHMLQDARIVGHAGHGDEIPVLVVQHAPDIVIVDLDEVQTPTDSIARLRIQAGSAVIVAISAASDRDASGRLYRAVAEGAHACLVKPLTLARIAAALLEATNS
jgi:AmiR/NasT family two-component response regulator